MRPLRLRGLRPFSAENLRRISDIGLPGVTLVRVGILISCAFS